MEERFANICRICLEYDSYFISISTSNIIPMLQMCSSVEVSSNDELPNQLCNNCFVQLGNFHQFKQTIEQSDKVLRKLLKEDVKEDFVKIEELCIKTEIEELSEEDPIYTENFKNIVPVDETYENLFPVDKNESIEQAQKESAQKPEQKISFPLFACAKCDFTCDNIEELCRHIKVHHFEGVRVRSKCNTCNQVFASKRQLNQHRPKCYKQFFVKYNPDDNTEHEENSSQFLCEDCGKCFSSRGMLNIHFRSHETGNWSCDVCDERFRKKATLMLHQRTRHLKTKSYACNFCDLRFTSYDDLKQHVLNLSKENH